jgi:hypothetical protein
MIVESHAPSLPFAPAEDFSAARRVAGHLSAVAFVAAILAMAGAIMTFSPSPDADCLPEICGPAQPG